MSPVTARLGTDVTEDHMLRHSNDESATKSLTEKNWDSTYILCKVSSKHVPRSVRYHVYISCGFKSTKQTLVT